MNKKPIMITGCAGFIGFHVAKRLLDEGNSVIGFDNINDYYDPKLKWDRLLLLESYSHFQFEKGSVENIELLESLFARYQFDMVIHLAAQAGVRYSLENPHQYIQANIVGFMNMLECCKQYHTKHLLYASSSSVYGNNNKIPFSVNDCVDEPISVYAATKKANELLAYTYSHLYRLPTTGMRFFTVYGPWGRPDMALFTFANAIMKEQPIDLYNFGKMKRDFTYIDDCVEAIVRLMKKEELNPYNIYNIGSNNPVELFDFVRLLEKYIGKDAKKNFLSVQPGDMLETYADTSELLEATSFQPSVPIERGIEKFVEWYKEYYQTEYNLPLRREE